MSIVELGECSRLFARISPKQCQKNRKNGTFACTECSGLTATKLIKAHDLVETKPVTVAAVPSPARPVPVLDPPFLSLVFTDDNLDIIRRFAALSNQCGGPLVDDLCTIIDLYLDEKLMLRKDI
ncbi:MAG: hypothetical protein M0023_04310 [Desulfobacteraceae bacterium]|nr:hypothetical protein [Desulfobacteraceae bacterium]